MNLSFHQAELGDATKLLSIAKQGEPGIRANNHMVYHLATTVLSRYTYFAVADNDTVGYFLALQHSRQQSLWLHQIVVGREHRGRGYGQKMLAHLEMLARSSNQTHIDLMVRPDNPARKLYEHQGYHEVELNDDLGMYLYRLELRG